MVSHMLSPLPVHRQHNSHSQVIECTDCRRYLSKMSRWRPQWDRSQSSLWVRHCSPAGCDRWSPSPLLKEESMITPACDIQVRKDETSRTREDRFVVQQPVELQTKHKQATSVNSVFCSQWCCPWLVDTLWPSSTTKGPLGGHRCPTQA